MVEGVADYAAGWGGGFQFGDYVEGVAGEGGGKIAERGGGGDAVFECGFGENAFPVLDGSTSGIEDADEDGAGIGWSLSGHWVILYGRLSGVKL